MVNFEVKIGRFRGIFFANFAKFLGLISQKNWPSVLREVNRFAALRNPVYSKREIAYGRGFCIRNKSFLQRISIHFVAKFQDMVYVKFNLQSNDNKLRNQVYLTTRRKSS